MSNLVIMKTIIKIQILMLLIGLHSIGNSQNLVPNPSFEEYTDCPNDIGQTYKATGWKSFCGTPDYFHACGVSDVGIPMNSFGSQDAASGNAYCGLFTSFGLVQNYREFIGAKLLNKLEIGHKYFISIKTSLADESNCSTDNLGVLFSMVLYQDSSSVTIHNYAKIYSHFIINNKTSWTIISGNIIADSAYQYIIVGNFFTDALTNKVIYSGSLCNAYYFIDNICVSEDSLGCELNTKSIDNTSKDNINVYPNPADQKIYINTNSVFVYSYSLFSLLGKEILHSETNYNTEIDISRVLSGIYFLRIQYNNKIIQQKQLIVHY